MLDDNDEDLKSFGLDLTSAGAIVLEVQKETGVTPDGRIVWTHLCAHVRVEGENRWCIIEREIMDTPISKDPEVYDLDFGDEYRLSPVIISWFRKNMKARPLSWLYCDVVGYTVCSSQSDDGL